MGLTQVTRVKGGLDGVGRPSHIPQETCRQSGCRRHTPVERVGCPCQLYKEPWVSVSGCKAATLQRLFETGSAGRLAQAIQRPAQVARRALRPCQGGIQVHVYPVHWR